MKALNLSNVKVIGFIPDFNSKKAYPEYGFGLVEVKKEIKRKPSTLPEKKIKVLSNQQLADIRAIKKAKKAFKKAGSKLLGKTILFKVS